MPGFIPKWDLGMGPEDGPFSVRIDKGEWVDPSRGGRVVPYKIYRPDMLDAGPYPVVVWSHGLGGTRDGAGFIARYLASRGYIHVHVEHEGTNDSLWRGLPGHPWDNIKKAKIDGLTVRNRFLDVPFALDQLEGIYPGKLDWDRVGMSGHSFGALTAQVMAGQLTSRSTPEDLHDDRFKAGVLYSPVPSKPQSSAAYEGIRIPLLHMTGTKDDSPVEGFPFEERLAVFEHAKDVDQHLLILNDADHMVFSGSRGQLPAYDAMEKHQDIIRVLTGAWWAAYLNGDENARDWLNSDGVSLWLAGEGVYKRN